MVKEQEHIYKMLDVKKEIYQAQLSGKWMREKDLRKNLARLETDWSRYCALKRKEKKSNV